ncbi:MAG: shikimate dehydrogenase, partial [Sporichthyaceae bacterium]|nr:shikimate dehydrogenase [Sporichthyaceae bacterium]
MADRPRRAAVLGSPIAHSLSPLLHRAAYAELGLDWTYGRHEVDAAGLPGFLAGLGAEWVGLSLTMPLKHAIIPLCDQISPLAATVGAVNTVLFGPDRSVLGANTDVPGLAAALAAAGIEAAPKRTAVLGGGATATSAVAAIAGLAGTGSVAVYVRSAARVAELTAAADRLETIVAVRPWTELAEAWRADLVISTVPSTGSAELAAALPDRVGGSPDRVGGSPDRVGGSPDRDGGLPDRVGGLLFDVVYDPWPTPLAAAWWAAGGRAVDGLSLLVLSPVMLLAAL